MRASANPAHSSPHTPRAGTLASPDAAFAQSPLGQALMHVLAGGSASQRQIADYLLRNQMRVTALGIEELADSCQVSTATISRFARDIGQKNYSAMRGAMAETLQSLLQPVDKLRRTIERRARTTSPITESLEYAAANIAATSAALSPHAMQAVVRRLTRARVVYVMGFGLSANLAGMLVQHLQPFCPHVVEVVGIGGSEVAAGHLVNLTAHDVLVVISFPRYTLDCIGLASFARDRGACIVALTDSPASPLAELADHALYAQSTHPVLPSSASTALAMIEALAVALMVSNKKNVEKAARLSEVIAAYLYGGEHGVQGPRKTASKQRKAVSKSL
ncbi:MurR/RpiR family transcriptional regulator [Janthinobacterium sp. PLB04]|uniref:MurR/RpiR family transcriptional regulator n=1 Tax=Janthinobacterium lividum TaxID=29581 RepID=A0AAJ4MS06_9BURK|nr:MULTISPECIES: MurR/RpiR family transcriptional regulator [Janthinobacterium]KAB0326918.1 MurR/RpiR family transcriptional regulator [Janthinobacterium lividum]MBR7633215.1 MurR/RpiR family transcriptional regulator [Janthinobacterium lividum]MDQ4626503.1 MurR/RpiR family transcriptional regulator [Janthinobacterium lividum]MDQ4674530.1 MurR/RpiR family transcriptional regulator [Janthinobacterium lividum]MDQ4685261.1 MurR/RpiR family transcriptional regulator [Janthinobacterium lividum]